MNMNQNNLDERQEGDLDCLKPVKVTWTWRLAKWVIALGTLVFFAWLSDANPPTGRIFSVIIVLIVLGGNFLGWIIKKRMARADQKGSKDTSSAAVAAPSPQGEGKPAPSHPPEAVPPQTVHDAPAAVPDGRVAMEEAAQAVARFGQAGAEAGERAKEFAQVGKEVADGMADAMKEPTVIHITPMKITLPREFMSETNAKRAEAAKEFATLLADSIRTGEASANELASLYNYTPGGLKNLLNRYGFRTNGQPLERKTVND